MLLKEKYKLSRTTVIVPVSQCTHSLYEINHFAANHKKLLLLMTVFS